MEKLNNKTQFEEDISQSFGVPNIRTEFVGQLHDQLIQKAGENSKKSVRVFNLQPAWVVVLAIFSLLIISILAIGPQQVYASVMKLFGYIPGIGVVDQTAPIRVLAQPVSVTRDGVTVSVNQAVLTASETVLNFGVSGVPLSSYPNNESIMGCVEREYLRLPSGSQVAIDAPIPADVDQATFILPCIFNTLPGAAPSDWEIPLAFIPAPADMTAIPVIETTPITPPTAALTADNEVEEMSTLEAVQNVAVSIEKVIATEDGYILIGALRPAQDLASLRFQITGVPLIRDAAGKKIAYTHPQDIGASQLIDTNSPQNTFALQFKGAGVTFPVSVEFQGVELSTPDADVNATLAFDAGQNLTLGQQWELNQEIQLGGYTFTLVSIQTDSRNGYSFEFLDPARRLYGVGVQIEGYAASGGGGGSAFDGSLYTSLAFEVLPKGALTLVFSRPVFASETQLWKGQWQPEEARDFGPAANDPSECLNAESLKAVPTLPDGLNGSVVLTQMNPQLRIAIATLDGSQIQEIAVNSARGALSNDGSRLAYVTDRGIEIKALADGQTSVIPGTFGRSLSFSPDGSRLAVINSGASYGIFMMDSDGKNQKQLTNLGYESIAGWSPDGAALYYAIPGASGNGFMLQAVDVQRGDISDLFVLEDSSRKEPWPALSPDGKWVAYRASNNSSVYLKGMDLDPARLLMDTPGIAITGLAWDQGSHLLAVGVITQENPDGLVLLVQPDTCETYRLPSLSGEVDGLIIP